MNLAVAITIPDTLRYAGVVFFFIAAGWNGWMAVASGISGGAGLYWLWDEYIDAGPRSEN
jgi:hypothetical protein